MSFAHVGEKMEEIVYIKNGEVVHPLPRPPKPAPYIIESSVELKKVKEKLLQTQNRLALFLEWYEVCHATDISHLTEEMMRNEITGINRIWTHPRGTCGLFEICKDLEQKLKQAETNLSTIQTKGCTLTACTAKTENIRVSSLSNPPHKDVIIHDFMLLLRCI